MLDFFHPVLHPTPPVLTLPAPPTAPVSIPPVSIPPASTQTSTLPITNQSKSNQITQSGVIFNNNAEEVKEVKIIATQAISVREGVGVNQTGVLFMGPVTGAEAKVSQLVGDITTLRPHEVEEVRGTLAFLRAPDSPLLEQTGFDISKLMTIEKPV
jgi:hypothetical protein